MVFFKATHLLYSLEVEELLGANDSIRGEFRIGLNGDSHISHSMDGGEAREADLHRREPVLLHLYFDGGCASTGRSANS